MSGTPGPWEAKRTNWRNEPDPHNFYIVGDTRESFDDDDEQPTLISTSVAIVVGNATCGTIAEENANLIAAAPDLLAACKAMLSSPTFGDEPSEEAVEMCRAAIAKAERPPGASHDDPANLG